MRLTEEQFNALAPYQRHFETAVRSQWARLTGTSALDLIHETYVQVTGKNFRLNKGCSSCILQLLTDMGTIFLADLEERKRREVGENQERKEVVKVEVKTKVSKKSKSKKGEKKGEN